MSRPGAGWRESVSSKAGLSKNMRKIVFPAAWIGWPVEMDGPCFDE